MTPTHISLADPVTLLVRWHDGHESRLPLRDLRDHCPCAGCQGETVLLHSYTPSPQPELPGKYSLAGAQPVGNYALQLAWQDGHATGIYTWETLRGLCTCTECTRTRQR